MTILRIESATKRYGSREIVSAVSLTITAGERLALIGHNGAGKTTLIRMILGLVSIDGGTISILGDNPGSPAARRATAYLPETITFHHLLTAREQLRAFAAMKGETESTADHLLERVGLAAEKDRRIATYSKGMRRRIGLAQALLGRPSLLLLDEPISGLDPIARRDFYGIIDDLAADGAAILLSSHALTEIEARTDRIAMLRFGRLIVEGTLDTLRQRAALPTRLRAIGRDGSAETLAAELVGKQINNRTVELRCDPGNKVERISAIAALHPLVEDIEVLPPTLDDLYRHFSRPGA